MGQAGLGKEHLRFDIQKVENDLGQLVVEGRNVCLANLGIRTIEDYVCERKEQVRRNGCRNRMKFYTPVTLKYQGEFLNRFQEEAIFRSILRRIYSFNCFEGSNADYLETEEEYPNIIEQRVKLEAIPRYSSTQNEKMKLRGISGYVIFEDLSEEMLTLLLAGEKLRIGKNTSFGFGKYKIQ